MTSAIVTVFDTETSGLPTRPSKFRRCADPFSETDRYDTSRMVELAYVTYLVAESGAPTLIEQRSMLVRPDGTFTITNDDIHGIAHALATTHGRPLRDVLVDFMTVVDRSDVVVSHNIEFDKNIVCAELVRINMIQNARTFMDASFVCTMKLAMDTFSLTRFPTLKALYQIVCNDQGGPGWTQTHRAMDDALRAADCYLDMIKRV